MSDVEKWEIHVTQRDGSVPDPKWERDPLNHAHGCIAADLRELTDSFLWVAAVAEPVATGEPAS